VGDFCLEAGKTRSQKNAGKCTDSHQSGARCVGRLLEEDS